MADAFIILTGFMALALLTVVPLGIWVKRKVWGKGSPWPTPVTMTILCGSMAWMLAFMVVLNVTDEHERKGKEKWDFEERWHIAAGQVTGDTRPHCQDERHENERLEEHYSDELLDADTQTLTSYYALYRNYYQACEFGSEDGRNAILNEIEERREVVVLEGELNGPKPR